MVFIFKNETGGRGEGLGTFYTRKMSRSGHSGHFSSVKCPDRDILAVKGTFRLKCPDRDILILKMSRSGHFILYTRHLYLVVMLVAVVDGYLLSYLFIYRYCDYLYQSYIWKESAVCLASMYIYLFLHSSPLPSPPKGEGWGGGPSAPQEWLGKISSF